MAFIVAFLVKLARLKPQVTPLLMTNFFFKNVVCAETFYGKLYSHKSFKFYANMVKKVK